MEIRLKDADATILWGIPEIDLHLSIESNDFTPVDFESLAPQQMKTIWFGIKNGILEAQNDTAFQKAFAERFLPKPKPAPTKTAQEPAAKQAQTKEALLLVKRSKELKKVLGNNVPTVKKVLPTLSAADLKLVISLESQNKKRKTVLSFAKELLGDGKKIPGIDNIVSPNAPSAEEYRTRQIFGGVGKQYLENLGEVVELNEEEIEIKIGEDDDST